MHPLLIIAAGLAAYLFLTDDEKGGGSNEENGDRGNRGNPGGKPDRGNPQRDRDGGLDFTKIEALIKNEVKGLKNEIFEQRKPETVSDGPGGDHGGKPDGAERDGQTAGVAPDPNPDPGPEPEPEPEPKPKKKGAKK